jgi:hypothetical protein
LHGIQRPSQLEWGEAGWEIRHGGYPGYRVLLLVMSIPRVSKMDEAAIAEAIKSDTANPLLGISLSLSLSL